MMRSCFPALLLALVVVGCAALSVHIAIRLGTNPDFVRLLTLARHVNTVGRWL
ncbi:hypothetical protein [Enterobacter ludwigii]|uniref:hypothetical protein n=1 Tax=Enterobacter ludwigii TaxID=299767 RepID=UPI0013D48434|nr:hypothetical protein [Enterobacter ludwigii]